MWGPALFWKPFIWRYCCFRRPWAVFTMLSVSQPFIEMIAWSFLVRPPTHCSSHCSEGRSQSSTTMAVVVSCCLFWCAFFYLNLTDMVFALWFGGSGWESMAGVELGGGWEDGMELVGGWGNGTAGVELGGGWEDGMELVGGWSNGTAGVELGGAWWKGAGAEGKIGDGGSTVGEKTWESIPHRLREYLMHRSQANHQESLRSVWSVFHCQECLLWSHLQPKESK